MNTLPLNLLGVIFVELDIHSLSQIFLVNKKFYKLCGSNYFWHEKLEHDVRLLYNIPEWYIPYGYFNNMDSWKGIYKVFHINNILIKKSEKIVNDDDMIKYFKSASNTYKEMTSWFNSIIPDIKVQDYVFRLMARALMKKHTKYVYEDEYDIKKKVINVLSGGPSCGKTTFRKFIYLIIGNTWDYFNIFYKLHKSSEICFIDRDNSWIREQEMSLSLKNNNYQLIEIKINGIYGDKNFMKKCESFRSCFMVFLFKYHITEYEKDTICFPYNSIV